MSKRQQSRGRRQSRADRERQRVEEQEHEELLAAYQERHPELENEPRHDYGGAGTRHVAQGRQLALEPETKGNAVNVVLSWFSDWMR